MSLNILYVHTFYSSAGGPHSPEEWCTRAAELCYSHIALADRAPLAALPALLKAASAAGLSAVAGAEIDIAGEGSPARPALLLAAGKSGLGNLAALAGAAYADWPRSEQPLDPQMLSACNEGIVLILPGLAEADRELASALAVHFSGRLYAGLVCDGQNDQQPGRARQVAAALELGIPLLALPVARYISPEDRPAYDALLEARRQAGWVAPDLNCDASAGYLRSPEDAASLFDSWPEVIENAAHLARACAALCQEDLAVSSPRSDMEKLKPLIEASITGQDLDPRVIRIEEQSHTRSITVELPASRRDDLFAVLAQQTDAAATASALQITPAVALRAAARTLNVESGLPTVAWHEAQAVGWDFIGQMASETGPEAQAARLAIQLQAAPLYFKPNRSALFFPGAASEHSALPFTLLAPGDHPGIAWVPWTAEEVSALGYPVVRLVPAFALSVLDNALRLAGEFPVPGFSPAEIDAVSPSLSERAAGMLKRGELAGVPYLYPKALKGWKGEFTLDNLAALVALSSYTKERPRAPEGVEAWAEHTAATGGTLLYLDQFDAILSATGGTSHEDAAALRLAMLDPGTDVDGTLHARFIAGCLQSGFEADVAARLYSVLAQAAPTLIPRDMAIARARTSMLTLELKAAHPAAFAAAWLDAAWERGGRMLATGVAEETRRLGVSLLAPDIKASAASPTLESEAGSEAWSVRWGLAQLLGWTRQAAQRFVTAHEATACATPGDFARACKEASLSLAQISVLVSSGACDGFGKRESLVAALPSLLEWAQEPNGPFPQLAESPEPGPRQRYLARQWEEQNLGVGFTDATEMETLRRLLDAAGDLRSRLITVPQIERSMLGKSICVVGLLHDIRLIDKPDGIGADPSTDNNSALPIAAATVEGLEGAIELVAFPPNYRRHQDLWVENSAVIITARVTEHRAVAGEPGEIYLLCEHLAPFGQGAEEGIFTVKVKASRRADTVPLPAPEISEANGGSNRPSTPIPPHAAKQGIVQQAEETQSPAATVTEPAGYHLVITLPISDDDHADIDRMIALNQLLRSRPGPDLVTLRIPYSPESGAVTAAQLPRGVRYTSRLEDDIRELLGPDALALIRLVG